MNTKEKAGTTKNRVVSAKADWRTTVDLIFKRWALEILGAETTHEDTDCRICLDPFHILTNVVGFGKDHIFFDKRRLENYHGRSLYPASHAIYLCFHYFGSLDICSCRIRHGKEVQSRISIRKLNGFRDELALKNVLARKLNCLFVFDVVFLMSLFNAEKGISPDSDISSVKKNGEKISLNFPQIRRMIEETRIKGGFYSTNGENGGDIPLAKIKIRLTSSDLSVPNFAGKTIPVVFFCRPDLARFLISKLARFVVPV